MVTISKHKCFGVYPTLLDDYSILSYISLICFCQCKRLDQTRLKTDICRFIGRGSWAGSPVPEKSHAHAKAGRFIDLRAG